jgi:hypothetical protein
VGRVGYQKMAKTKSRRSGGHDFHTNNNRTARSTEEESNKDLPRASGGERDDGQSFDCFLNLSKDGADLQSQLRCLCGQTYYDIFVRCA